jgi:hypothetical protein
MFESTKSVLTDCSVLASEEVRIKLYTPTVIKHLMWLKYKCNFRAEAVIPEERIPIASIQRDANSNENLK